MRLPHPVPVTEIAEWINARVIGDHSLHATGINEIHKVQAGDITFSDLQKYFRKALDSAATIIILNEETECPPGKAILVCEKPFPAYDSIVKRYRPFEPAKQMIDPSAVIHQTAIIEPNVFIGAEVRIGSGSYIQSGAIIRSRCLIGERVEIQSGAIIGTDAFYFKKYPGKYQKWTCGGRVIIEDDAQIGAGCTINKGVSGDTIIGAGTKMDCLVQIGHGAVVGKNCLIAAQVGIAGKTIVGDNCVLYGQVGVAQNLKIGDGVTIYAQSGIMEDLETGKTYFGSPAEEARNKFRELAIIRRLVKDKGKT